MITESAEAGIGIVIRGGVTQGGPGHGRGREETWQKFQDAGLDELREDVESRSAFVLRYSLTHPHVHAIIAGTKSPAHLGENLEASRRGPLSPDAYAETKRLLDKLE